jgi:phosphoglycolate phosphatase-like HAD superfamily hydrolase
MRDVLMRATGSSRERITTLMQNYYGRAETMESSWLVQDLHHQGVFKGIDLDRQKLITEVREAFHTSRNRSLALYEGIDSVLHLAYEQDINNIILSDAPACHAASRIKHLDVEQDYFTEMHAMKDSLPEEVPGDFHEKFDGGLYGLQFPVHHLDREKPHTDLESVLDLPRERFPEEVVIVGDSAAKDMQLAARYGCLGIHALWGCPDPAKIRTISEFASPRLLAKNSSVTASIPASARIIGVEHPTQIPALLGWE